MINDKVSQVQALQKQLADAEEQLGRASRDVAEKDAKVWAWVWVWVSRCGGADRGAYRPLASRCVRVYPHTEGEGGVRHIHAPRRGRGLRVVAGVSPPLYPSLCIRPSPDSLAYPPLSSLSQIKGMEEVMHHSQSYSTTLQSYNTTLQVCERGVDVSVWG